MKLHFTKSFTKFFSKNFQGLGVKPHGLSPINLYFSSRILLSYLKNSTLTKAVFIFPNKIALKHQFKSRFVLILLLIFAISYP